MQYTWQTVGGACRAIGPTLGLGCLLTFGLVLAGCTHGSPTAPDEIAASWDEISFASPPVAGHLSIDGAGHIAFSGAPDSADPGLLGPTTWRELEQALQSADLEPLAEWFAMDEPDRGFVAVTIGEELLGFAYTEET